MHSEVKFHERNGCVFSNKGNVARGEYFEMDLSGIRIIHSGVDTFKQLIRGFLNPDILNLIGLHYDSNVNYPIVFGDYQFKVSKAGSKSGFQWILRNNGMGIVVMLKSFYAQSDEEGTHCKIEYSPHFILNNSPAELDAVSAELASMFMNQFVFADVAVHLATDIKGWSAPDDLEKRMRTKAKRSYTFAGISEFDFDVSAVAVKYGQKESFTFGGAGSIQACIYDKTKEVQAKDKAQFWSEIWSKTPSVDDCFDSEYKEGDQVTRIEFRFHHSVIRQFCKGTKAMEVTNFSQLSSHLTGLYKYALDNFRLHRNKNYIDPLWQLLLDDVVFFDAAKPLIYKRSYKGESASSRRNVAFWMGNAMRLFARQGFTVDTVVNYFMQSGLFSDLKAYCKIPPNSTQSELFLVLHEFVRKRMDDHFLEGVHV